MVGHLVINAHGHTIQRDPALFSPASGGDGVDPCSGDGEKFRVMHLSYPGADLTLNDAVVANGCSTVYAGGGILHEGHVLNLNRVSIANNKAAIGGGIFVFQAATATVIGSRLTGNSADAGGGIYVASATLSVTSSTLDHNSAVAGAGSACVTVFDAPTCFPRGSGGGLALSQGTTTVSNSTIADNTAPNGGALNNRGATAIFNRSTLTRNSAGNGGGVYSYGGSTRFVHATVVENSAAAGGAVFIPTKLRNVTIGNSLFRNASGNNCAFGLAGAGAITAGYNLASDASCGLAGTGDHQNVADLRLASYADEGAPGTGHFPLLPGSPAIDAGTSDGSATDQVGELRIGAPDIGAIEYPRSVKVWIGVKGATDIGLRVDLLAETFLNGSPSGQSQLNNLTTGKNGFTNAILYTVPIPVQDVPSGTQIQLRVSARRSCSGAGLNSGTVRLWYNGLPIDGAPGRDAGSRVGATAAGQTGYLFLREGFLLDPAPGPGGAADLFLDEPVNSASACTGAGRPFTPFGTWSATIP